MLAGLNSLGTGGIYVGLAVESRSWQRMGGPLTPSTGSGWFNTFFWRETRIETREDMMTRAVLIVVAASFASSCDALQLGSSARLFPRVRVAMAGGPAPAVPKTRTVQVTRTAPPQVGKPAQKQKVQNAKPAMKKDMAAEPMWKVVMLGDDEYECDPVCDVLMTVIPDIEKFQQAKEKYDEAESTGKAMLLVVPKEHAEAYVEQLIRAEPMVYAEIEEE